MPSISRSLAILFLINVMLSIYWSAMNPFIPLFIRSLDATIFQVSIVLFIGGLVATAVMVPSGFLSDKYGERRIIVISMIFLAASPLLYTLVNTWEETILYTIINMAAFSLFIPARMSLIASNVRSSVMATAYGLMNIAWPIGGILGPLIGGFIIDNYGWNHFFYNLSIIALICAFLGLFLEDERRTERRVEGKRNNSFWREAFWILLVLFLLHIAGNTARGILNTVFPFYITENFNKSNTEAGFFFSFGFGAATLIAQLPSGLLADKFGRKRVMVYFTIPIPIVTSLLLMLNDYILVLIVYTVITSLWSATWPASTAYLMALTPPSKRGSIIAVRQTAIRLGFTIGPLIGGFLWDAYGPTSSFYFTIFFFALSFILVLLLKD